MKHRKVLNLVWCNIIQTKEPQANLVITHSVWFSPKCLFFNPWMFKYLCLVIDAREKASNKEKTSYPIHCYEIKHGTDGMIHHPSVSIYLPTCQWLFMAGHCVCSCVCVSLCLSLCVCVSVDQINCRIETQHRTMTPVQPATVIS